MLKIECPHCGGTHSLKQLNVETIKVTADDVTYKDYAVICIHCGKPFRHERFAQKAQENYEKAKQKAMRALAKSGATKKKQSMYAVNMPIPKNGHMTDEGAKRLLAAILGRAAIDSNNKKYKNEVCSFLKSDWGETVCEGLGTAMKVCDGVKVEVNPDAILKSIDEGKIDMKYLIFMENNNYVQEDQTSPTHP